MGSNLIERERTEFIKFLTANIEVFAWTLYEMPRIDPDYIKHKLNVIPKMKLIKQQGHISVVEQVDLVIKEVEKLKKGECYHQVSLPQLVIQYSYGKEKDRQVESLH